MSDPRQRIDELSRGFMHSAVLLTALHVGLFDALGAESRTVSDLSGHLGLDERATRTLLLALAAEGILHCEGGEAFRLDPAFAPFLLPGAPGSMASLLRHNYHLLRRWARLDEVLRTGRPVEREPAGEDEMRAFICGMADISRASSREVADKIDLAPFRRMLDLGGGPATAAITFAQRNPELRAVVFDLPGPLTIAREEIDKANLADRVTTLAGDYTRDPIGAGYDFVYVSNIIHSMGDEETAALLEKCRAAMLPGGTIVIKEFFLEDDRIAPPAAALFSVNMLVNTPAGKSYTLAETKEILAGAGFGDFHVIDVASHSRLLIARLPG